MKKLILQVNIKPDGNIPNMKRFKQHAELYHISMTQAQKFSKIWETDYHVITDTSFLPKKHAVFQRLKMYEMNYDQILYLDCDAVILDNCPDVFELFKEHKFSAVRNYDWSKTKYDEKRLKDIEIYGAKSDYRPFCSGVMLVRRDFLNETQTLWRNYLDSYDSRGEHDQGVFNKMVIENGGIYNELNEDWGAWYKQGKYIDHLGGPFRKVDFNKDKYVRKMKLTDFYLSDESLELFQGL